jgi:hypothetical protein
MQTEEQHNIPARCPITGEELYVSELTSAESGVTIRGRFGVPKIARLPDEHREFLETFIRARGVISTVEKELGISYPTVRSRLDALLEALEMKPIKEDRRKAKTAEERRKILQDLEDGRITAEEAKVKLREKAKA